jgi:hypothetical protein
MPATETCHWHLHLRYIFCSIKIELFTYLVGTLTTEKLIYNYFIPDLLFHEIVAMVALSKLFSMSAIRPDESTAENIM